MAASNMAGTPAANPTLGAAVLMSPFSGPKGSPFDAKVYPSNIYQPKLSDLVPNLTDVSTGALSTGIGYGLNTKVPGISPPLFSAAIPATVDNFTDDYQPGVSLPSVVAAPDARLLAIGGGRSTANTLTAPTTPNPYAVQPLLGWGNGGSRDGGAGPAFTGFGTKLVTAVAPVANGAAIEAGWTNRSGVQLETGNSQFGSSTTASAAIT